MQQFPPEDAEHVVTFTVMGKAAPAGSKKAIPLTRKDATGARVSLTNERGYPRFAVVDSSGARGYYWRANVKESAWMNLPPDFVPLTEPVVVEMIFVRERPKAHYRTGKHSGLLRDSAPLSPITRPDSQKLARGTTDALSGVIWKDDSQIVDEKLTKEYGEQNCCHVSVWKLAATVSATMRLALAA